MLRARGHEPLLLPLQEVRPLDPPLGAGPFGGFLATSTHAAPWLARHAAGANLPVLAVGARTAEALRAAGVRQAVAGPGRAADLAALAAEAGPGGAPLVYAAGQVRLPDLEACLRAAGVAHEVRVVYAMDERRPDDAEIEALGRGGPPDAVFLLSRRQTELFEELAARRPDFLPVSMRHLCLSQAVAARLAGGREGEWGVRPTLDDLLERLG